METLTSAWAPGDASDLAGEAGRVWEECVFNRTPPAGDMWSEQLSPHLQRNKQLRDTLLQREEELSRLQEENSKLREFLGSSFVRNLQEKRKSTARKLKRNLTHDHTLSCNVGRQASHPVSKRVCRNLTAEFCSEAPPASEPALDLWVLRTLGLKDRDTIDMSACQQSWSVTPPPSYCQSSPGESERGYRSSEGPPGHTDSLTPVHTWTGRGPCEDAERHFSRTPQGAPFCSSTQPSHSACWSPGTASPVRIQSCCQSDLAFSMSLSPSSSVKTLSFPQGQAFVRRDPQGRWNFTWVPTQTSHNALA